MALELPPDRSDLPQGLALWHGVLFHPRVTLEAWGEDLPLGPAIAVLPVLAGIASLLVSGPSLGAVLVGVPVVLGFLLVGWISSVSVGYLGAAFAGSRAPLAPYMAAAALALLPLLFVPPLVVAFGWGTGWRAASALALLGVVAWGSRLSHLAMAVTLGLGDQRAVLVSLGTVAAVLTLPALYVALILGLGLWMGL